jgi:hypothetical protein
VRFVACGINNVKEEHKIVNFVFICVGGKEEIHEFNLTILSLSRINVLEELNAMMMRTREENGKQISGGHHVNVHH